MEFVDSCGILNICDEGLMTVAGTMTIDYRNFGTSFVYISNGGTLTLNNQGDASIANLLNLINGTDAICYWDESLANWANISLATYGQDYTLNYIAQGDLAGYTTLTVTAVPEPATLGLLLIGSSLALRRRQLKK